MRVNRFFELLIKREGKLLKFPTLGFVVFLFMSIVCTEAQIKPIEGFQRIRKYNYEQGFFQNTVKSITADKNGYLWFSTPNGLIRYDGYDFENYYHDFEDNYSILNNSINKILKSSDGNLWIGTKGCTCVYFPDEERFLSLENSIRNDAFIKEDSKQNIWIAQNDKLYVYRPMIDSEAPIVQPKILQLDTALNNQRIIDILFLSDYQYLVATAETLLLLTVNLEEEEPLAFETSPIQLNIKNKKITKLLRKENAIWLGTKFGFYQTFLENNELIVVREYTEFGKGKMTWRPNVLAMYSDSSKNLWIGTERNGILKLNNDTKDFTLFSKGTTDEHSISSDQVFCFFEDEFDVLWIGTIQGGLNSLDKHQKPFHNYIQKANEANSIPENLITDIVQAANGNIWFSHYKDVISTTKSNFGVLTKAPLLFEKMKNKLADISRELIFCMYQDTKGYWWLGGKKDVYLYDEVNDVLKKVTIQNEFKAIGFRLIKSIRQVDERQILIGGGQLLLLENPWESILNNQPVQIKSELLNLGYVNDIVLEKDNFYWIATREGLYKVKLEQGKLSVALHLSTSETSEKLKLNHNTAFSIYKDKNRNLWLATYGGGLIKIQLDKDRNPIDIKNYTKKNGLPDNGVYGILEDDESKLWISTDMGICKFDPIKEKFQTFNVDDGLLNNNYRQSAYLKTKSGVMLMAGANGLTVFDPKQIKENTIPPKLHLSQLEVNDELVVPGKAYNNQILCTKSITEIDTLILNDKNTNISFKVTVNHSAAPNKNRLYYKLQGLNKEWITSKSGKATVSYTNLSTGNYTFLYKATNGDGVESIQTGKLYIKVLAPWYLTWWSLAGCILLIIIVLYLVFEYLFRLEKLKQNLKIEKLDKKRNQEMEEAKLRFFTNISHDFKTPLALIKGPFEKIAENNPNKEDKKYFSIIQNNITRLQTLVEELISYRKAETGHLDVKYSKTTVGAFLYPLMDSFEENTKDTHVQFFYKIENPEEEIHIDIHKTERVLLNLYSNAVKYSGTKSTITFTAGIKETEENTKLFYFEIEDTGIGISRENLKRIFDRFYRGVDEVGDWSGVGVGLALSKSLVELMGGTITAESDLGKKTVFNVVLPVNHEAIDGNETAQSAAKKVFEDFTPAEVEAVSPATISKEIANSLPTILIIDDEQDMRLFLQKALANSFNVALAIDGEDGLEKMAAIKPQIVISDVMMPNLNGYQVCAKIKSTQETCHIPVILLTALGDTKNKIEGLELGADDYISKPFSIKHLEVRIKQLIENKQRIIDYFSNNSLLPIKENLGISKRDQEFLEKNIKTMEENISDVSFGVEELAKSAGMSASNFYRRLKQLTGQAPNAYLRNFRLQKAAELIRNDKNLQAFEIMSHIGISSPSYYSTAFKKLHGMSPMEYSKSFGG